MNISTHQEPPLIKGNFLFGHLFNLKKEGITFYERMAREHGDAIRIKILHKTYYLFLHPDHNKEVLVDKSDVFIKGEQYNSLRLLLGNGLLTSEGTNWLKQRKMLNPLFGKEGMEVLLSHIKEVSKEKVNLLPHEKELDWTKFMFDYTIEVAIRCFFGSSLNDEQKQKFNIASVGSIRFISRKMAGQIGLPLIFPTKTNCEFKASLNFLKNTVHDIYQSRIASTVTSKDMLDMLIAAQDDEAKRLSAEDIFDQILSFLIAGHETTAMTMSWLFYLIAQDQLVEKKLVEEMERNNFAFESSLSLTNYPYLTAVLNETMRLYPAGWVIARDIAQDSQVGQFKVKKGRVLAVSPFISHRDSRWWNEPLSFKPERFLGETTTKNAFLPFSLGKRNCIGSRFAMIEMAVFTINFFRQFTVTSSQEKIEVKGYVTLKPAKPIFVRIKKRI